MPLAGGHDQRIAVAGNAEIHIGTALEEETHDWHVTFTRGGNERRAVAIDCRIDVRAGIEELVIPASTSPLAAASTMPLIDGRGNRARRDGSDCALLAPHALSGTRDGAQRRDRQDRSSCDRQHEDRRTTANAARGAESRRAAP